MAEKVRDFWNSVFVYTFLVITLGMILSAIPLAYFVHPDFIFLFLAVLFYL